MPSRRPAAHIASVLAEAQDELDATRALLQAARAQLQDIQSLVSRSLASGAYAVVLAAADAFVAPNRAGTLIDVRDGTVASAVVPAEGEIVVLDGFPPDLRGGALHPDVAARADAVEPAVG